MSLEPLATALWPQVSAGRFAARIVRGDAARARLEAGAREIGEDGPVVALVGLPDDTGIVLNRGRPGAAAGPAAFRAALARYGTDWDQERDERLGVPIIDAGDVLPASGTDADALLETHERVTGVLAAVHEAGFLPVCVGGGHDLTLPTVRALGARPETSPLGGINVDAHLDVREAVGSGMPFRALIDGAYVDATRFVTFGVGRFVHDPDHVRWLEERGATLVAVAEARSDPEAVRNACARALDGPAFVSVDLDALDGAYAPGVSAVNPDGLDVATVGALVERAGRAPDVRHVDFMELSPPHDPDGRTARVAAHLFLRLVSGLAERPR